MPAVSSRRDWLPVTHHNAGRLCLEVACLSKAIARRRDHLSAACDQGAVRSEASLLSIASTNIGALVKTDFDAVVQFKIAGPRYITMTLRDWAQGSSHIL
jgi:hypothetical protein